MGRPSRRYRLFIRRRLPAEFREQYDAAKAARKAQRRRPAGTFVPLIPHELLARGRRGIVHPFTQAVPIGKGHPLGVRIVAGLLTGYVALCLLLAPLAAVGEEWAKRLAAGVHVAPGLLFIPFAGTTTSNTVVFAAGEFIKGTTVTTQAITGTGIALNSSPAPYVILLQGTNVVSAGTSAAHATTVVGAATGTANQMSASTWGSDATAANLRLRCSNNGAIYDLINFNGTGRDRGLLSALGADGFTINWTVQDIAAATYVHYLVISGLTASKVCQGTAPASATTMSFTGAGFTPSFAWVIAPMTAGMDGSGHGNHQLSVGWTNGTEHWASGFSEESAVGTSDCARVCSAKVVHIPNYAAGADLWAATFSAWTSDGMTLSFSASGSATQNQMIAVFTAGMDTKVGNATAGASPWTVTHSWGKTPGCIALLSTTSALNTLTGSASLSLGWNEGSVHLAMNRCSTDNGGAAANNRAFSFRRGDKDTIAIRNPSDGEGTASIGTSGLTSFILTGTINSWANEVGYLLMAGQSANRNHQMLVGS